MTINKRFAGTVVSFLLLLGACGGDSPAPIHNVGPDAAVDQKDACDLLTQGDAQAALGRVREKEGFESGIGPGCTYRNGDQRLGMNLYNGTYTRQQWVQTVLQPLLNSMPAEGNPKPVDLDDVGEAAVWVKSDTVHRLIVLTGGRAFDLFVQLEQGASDGELRQAAVGAARAVIKRLAKQQTPAATPEPTRS